MPDLGFTITGVEVVPYAASPMLAFKMKVTNEPENEPIRAIDLRVQIQIEAARRSYDPTERQDMRDLFGEPHRWGHTLRNMLWAHTTAAVPRFAGAAAVDVLVPCSFDFNVAATKYFHGLRDGELPLCFQFSGNVFYEGPDQTLQVTPIPWDKETRHRLPVHVWKKLMDTYYPNSAWLALRKDTFEKLYRYKMQNGIPTWEEAIERALNVSSEPVSS